MNQPKNPIRPTIHPIDLDELFGDRFRVSWEAAAYCKKERTPWLLQVEGKYGTIYPYSDKLLAVECDYHRSIQKQLLLLPCELHQDGEDEKTFLFPVDKFHDVAKIIRAYKKYNLSPENRAVVTKRIESINKNKNTPLDTSSNPQEQQ